MDSWILWYSGNDRADKLAKLGTSKTQHDAQVSYATDHTNEVSEDLAGQVGSWQHWTDLLPAPTNSKPDRLYQPTTQSTSYCYICLRTHHTPLNAHLHRIKKDHPAKCVYCPDSDETVEHFLCPLYDNITSRLLPAQPNIHNTLYGSNTQLQRTATYNMSAMNRRDKIVRSLGEQER